MSAIEDLETRARIHPNGIAFIAGDVMWSYRRLNMMVSALAAGLHARGIGPGDRVALHLPTSPEMAIAYYACFRIGAIAAPINNRFKGPELEHVLDRLRPALYVGDETQYAAAKSAVRKTLPLDRRFVVGPSSRFNGAQPWSALVPAETEGTFVGPTELNAPAVLLSTSGTTGQPKFVAHSMSTLSAITDTFAKLEIDDSQIILNSLPMVHATGLSVLLRAVRVGAPMVLLSGFHPEAALDAIAAHGVSWLPGLPFMFDGLLEAQRRRPRDISSLRFCVSGGDVCPIALQRDFGREFSVPLRSLWGSTETVGSLIPDIRPGAVYRSVPDAQIRLINDAGETVSDGRPGELVIRGANVAEGYWQRPGVIDPIGPDGWFHTGDLMRHGGCGELWFVSRKKDLIVRGGSNIAPVEVEGVLLSDPRVIDAAVVGIRDAKLGQRVAAAVQLADGVDATALDTIRNAVRERLADYKTPEWLIALDAIPRNQMGKIDRIALADVMVREREAVRSKR